LPAEPHGESVEKRTGAVGLLAFERMNYVHRAG
jgi:hypothetical protein